METENLALMIREKTREYGDKSAMRYREGDTWKVITYNEMGDDIESAAKALIDMGIKEGDMVGIFSGNRPEWAIADFAIHMVKGVSVPIYSTNTAKQAEYIIDDAKIKLLFVANESQYQKIKTFSDRHTFLEKIVVFDKDVPLSGENSIYFNDMLIKGSGSSSLPEIDKRLELTSPEDLATLIYTSGTTGDPKGVMLTHGNFFHQQRAIDAYFNVTSRDKSLCFLPLSHAYERSWSYILFSKGAENNYLKDPKLVIEYMNEVRPTAMVSVPRLYEKIYSTVYDRLDKASSLKRNLFNWAVGKGKKYAYKKKDGKFVGPFMKLQYAFADRVILSKIRDAMGGYKNFFSAGGAPLSEEIEEFFFAAGLLVCQGYGLTETAPMITCNRPGDFKFGTVGKIIPECEIKIAPDGEILVRGPNLMKGYYNKPEATAETIVGGWLKTGDVGFLDDEGFLRITDRIKDLIITSQGKNVAPQHIETLVGVDHYIEQIATIGDQRKYIVALIVPNFEALEEYAGENGISFSNRDELIKHEEIIRFFEQRIADRSVELARFEQIKKFTLLSSEFTQEGGELTPTLKIKRKVVAEKYKDIIDAMYV